MKMYSMIYNILLRIRRRKKMLNSVSYLDGIAYAEEQLKLGATVEDLEEQSLGESHPFDKGVLEVLRNKRTTPAHTDASNSDDIKNTRQQTFAI